MCRFEDLCALESSDEVWRDSTVASERIMDILEALLIFDNESSVFIDAARDVSIGNCLFCVQNACLCLCCILVGV